MNVDEVMNRTVYSCSPDDSLKSAAQQMWDRDIGCLAVVDAQQKTIGMVTDRDLLMCALLSGRSLSDERVSRAMSKELHAVQLGESIARAEAVMQSKQVRRLAIVDREGKIAGVLSLNDLALAAGKKRAIRAEEVVATLASICQPRAPASSRLG